MKKCVTCGVFKSESEYAWRHKLRRVKWGTCKSCQSGQRAKWYQNNKESHKATVKKNRTTAKQAAREYIDNYLDSSACVDCGESNPNVLEFDHVKGKKKATISKMIREGYSIGAIQKELRKCVVRCANCHRIKTAKERGWFRSSRLYPFG